MSTDVEFHLVAYDEASDVVEEMGNNLSATFTDIEGNTQELVSQTDSATNQMSTDYGQAADSAQALNDAQEQAVGSGMDSAMSMNNCALAGSNLYMAYNRVQNAEVSVDRANLQVEKSTIAVQTAQNAYNVAVAKFGADSPQAQLALEKLDAAQDQLTVAQERAGSAQRNLNDTMLSSALMVIPSLIAIINTVSNATQIWSGIQVALNAVMDANPIALVILAIAGLVTAITVAYETCKPFRDIINEIGGILSGFFLAALNAVRNAWDAMCRGIVGTWNSVMGPFIGVIEAFANAIKTIFDLLFSWIVGGSIWRDMCEGLVAIWNAVVGPLLGIIHGFVNGVVGFFQGLASTLAGIWKGIVNDVQAAVNAISAAISTISNAASSVGSTITGAAGTVASGMGSVASSVGGALSSAGGAISGFIGSICFAHALERAANSSKATMSSWNAMIQDSMNKGLESIKNFGAQSGLAGSLGGGGIPLGGNIPAPPTSKTVQVTTQAPLVNIEGSADKATVDLASKQVLDTLKSIIIEPTSTSAPATQKRIRQGAVFT